MQHDLVIRAQSGDHEAFAGLAAACVARLHRTARLILRDDERASDAVQDALLHAWLDIRAVRDPSRFDAWVNKLLVRSCYHEARRHRRIRAVEVRVDVLEAPGDHWDGGSLAIRDVVDRGFRSLTPDQRAVLVAHHYLGLSDDEAAEVLGIPPGTLKSRLHRATRAMRAAIESDERAPERSSESIA